MMTFDEAKVTNVKISIKCLRTSLDTVVNICEKNLLKFKKFDNFIVVYSDCIYTIFKSKENDLYNHINITKIREIENIKVSLDNLQHFGFNIIYDSVKIDNVTGSMNIKKEIILQDLIKYIRNSNFEENISLSFNNETFPGLFIKLEKDSRKIGTIIIFHSGKIVFVGCKSLNDLKHLRVFILAVTQVITSNI